MADRCIYQLVYSRHREGIFWAGLIQICEVHTYSPLPALLLHYYDIGQPFEVKDLIDNPCLFKLHHLFPDSVCMFFGWVLRRLLLGNDGWVNVQMMANKI